MEKRFSIDILGTDWTVELCNDGEDVVLDGSGGSNGSDGYADWTGNLIRIADRRKESNLENPEQYLLKVLRHEIVHAYMKESGLLGVMWTGADQEELLVDWIAVQFHKIVATIILAERNMMQLLRQKDGEQA